MNTAIKVSVDEWEIESVLPEDEALEWILKYT